MISVTGKAHSFSKKQDSDRKQKKQMTERTKKPVTIRGHNHQVRYHKNKKRGSTYECSGCQEPGFGPYYKCIEGCNVHYHLLCCDLLGSDFSSAASVGNHAPYPTGHLVVKEMAPRKVRCCVACGDQVRGLRYKVEHKKVPGLCNPYWCLYQQRAFHPLCASLPAQMQELPMQIKELTPQIQKRGDHGMVLVLKEKIRGGCLICKANNAKGWAYNSICGEYRCHVWCMKKIIQSWQQDEASQNGGKKREVKIYVKKGLPLILEIAKLALQLIIGALFGVPPEIISKFFEFLAAA